MTDTNYHEFFLGSRSSVVQLETLQISHSAFSKQYNLVRNAQNGLTAFLENGDEVDFEYRPIKVEGLGSRDNLDFGLSIQLGDLGEVLPVEMDAVKASETGFAEKPAVVYRSYRSDDLSRPLYGPVVLEVRTFSFTEEGAAFEANAPSLNTLATGELYNFDRFPMLRGFV